MNPFPDSYCRKCDGKNHVVFFAPVFVAGMDARNSAKHEIGIGTHICMECAIGHGFADSQGNLRAGITL